MKKAISLLLALVLCLSLCACDASKSPDQTASTEQTQATAEQTEVPTEPIVKLTLGEAASTDLAEFTLEKSSFTHYVSNVSSNFVEPTDKPNEIFAASIGHCFVSVTFTITNKDRGGSISYASTFAEWNPNWTVSYGGADYPVKGFDLNNNKGRSYIGLFYSAIIDRESGETLRKHSSDNYLLSAGETVTLRAFGIIDIDPENLTDGYEFTVGVPNSKGEYEFFTYTVPAQQ